MGCKSESVVSRRALLDFARNQESLIHQRIENRSDSHIGLDLGDRQNPRLRFALREFACGVQDAQPNGVHFLRGAGFVGPGKRYFPTSRFAGSALFNVNGPKSRSVRPIRRCSTTACASRFPVRMLRADREATTAAQIHRSRPNSVRPIQADQNCGRPCPVFSGGEARQGIRCALGKSRRCPAASRLGQTGFRHRLQALPGRPDQ